MSNKWEDGTVIYSEYDGGYQSNVMLVKTNSIETIKNKRAWTECISEGNPLLLDGFALFDLFDKAFGERYDKIAVIDNARLVKARIRGSFDPSKDHLCQVIEFRGDGEAAKIIEEKEIEL